ncbi:isochorismatase family protein [Pleurocapsa sp. PCC 7319]|uniref:isochorismatase family protein n=1 Tax=Pleurocapsa sp. PCC 7319 TaxID=118161 RepID=UPI00034B1CB5|nr:isochorismatase family protein [Pleurocapsa sp. PCC 7319]
MSNINEQAYPRIYHDEDRLTKDNATLILIDHQTGLLSACRDIATEKLRSNILALAKIGKVFDLPVILTQGGYGGENAGGPLIGELVEMFPNVPIIDRHHVNAYDDPNFREQIKQYGRKKLIMAGCTTDVCLAFPAMSAVADGYDVYAVIDASGNWDLLTTQAAMMRMSQAGVIVTNWAGIWGELLRDHHNPEDQPSMQVVGEHIPALGFITNNLMYAKGMYPNIEDRLQRAD